MNTVPVWKRGLRFSCVRFFRDHKYRGETFTTSTPLERSLRAAKVYWKYRPSIGLAAPSLARWWICSLKIPVNQLVMRKVLDGKSSTASKRKTSLWKCPFVLEFIFHSEFSSRFLSKRSHIFQMLKSEWKSYFIQPSPTLRTLSSGRRKTS